MLALIGSPKNRYSGSDAGLIAKRPRLLPVAFVLYEKFQ
jgi:hypothetical protein